ncbi:MAG TPA: polyamine ABC transporter substrate-binding protein [Bordetella sp.]|nr:polyamine ABC transporter substrate-binding protein [Bordetella sp.]
MKARFLSGITLACAAMGAQAADSITLASWGGSFQKAQREAWFTPAEKALGITIREDTTSGLADVRTQVASGRPAWDIVQQGNQSCPLMEQEGLLEKLDPAIVDTTGIPDNMKSDYWVADVVYGVVIGWNKQAIEGAPPQNWKDFWNTADFPGMRSLRRSPLYNIEAALLADGVAPKDIYPPDVDRAFRKLAELKPSVGAWWGSGAESVQLMQNEEVDMSGIWNGRIQDLMLEDERMDFTWNQQIVLYDCLAIPKGAQNKEAAMKVLAYLIKPETQARLSTLINYAPANEKAYETGIISPELAAKLPNSPANRDSAVTLDTQWWSKNYDAMSKRFDLLLQR